VLLPVARFSAPDAEALYAGVYDIAWADHLPRGGTLAIDFTGVSPNIRNSLFGAQRTKDAVCDALRDREGWRPRVDLQGPDVRLNVHLRDDSATVAIDLSGMPLGRRGWRSDGGPAPLKENLAATLLAVAGWPGPEDRPFADVFCGSGTLLIEAAHAALDRAPGLSRLHWGFDAWLGHEERIWRELILEAEARSADCSRRVVVFGSDIDPAQVTRARENAERAGVADHVRLRRWALGDARPPQGAVGTLVCNPPYGERLGATEELRGLYRSIGDTLRRSWLGWDAWVFTGNPRLAKSIGLRPAKRVVLYNGPLECRFVHLPIATTAPERSAPGWRAAE
jgi:23S rRNA (guanine2445-N2)-methyltransferase / 23S rRNA (guanine2069-N7)-methyltransferase